MGEPASEAIGKLAMDMEESPSLAALGMISAMREVSQGLDRVAKRQDHTSEKLDKIDELLHKFDKRLDLIEHRESQVEENKKNISELDKRLALIEADKNRQQGAVGLVSWIMQSWPAIFGFILLVAMLIAGGFIKAG